MRSRKQRSTKEAIARVTQHAQGPLGEGPMAGMLLIDFKRSFDHVSSNDPMRKMEAMGIDDNLVRWTRSFM